MTPTALSPAARRRETSFLWNFSNAEARTLIRTICFAAFFFYVVACLYGLVNNFVSHDSLNELVELSPDWQVSTGRFMQPFYWAIRGPVAAPFLVGIMSWIWSTLAALMVCDLFRVRSRLTAFLITGVLIANPVVTMTEATFVEGMDVFLLAACLAVAAVWFTRNLRFGWIAGIFCLVACMGLYQAYVSVAIVLYLLLLVMDLLRGEHVGPVVIQGLWDLLVIAVGFAGYYLCYRLSLVGFGVIEATSYNSLNGVFDFSGESLLGLIGETWFYPFYYTLNPETAHPFLTVGVNVLLAVLTVAFLAWRAWDRNISVGAWFLAIGLLLLTPWGANVTYFIGKGYIYTLLVYAYFYGYVFVLALSEPLLRRVRSSEVAENEVSLPGTAGAASASHHATVVASRPPLTAGSAVAVVVAVLVGTVLFNNVIFANQAYLRKDLEYQATAQVMNRVIDRMEQTDGYEPGVTEVVFLEEVDTSPILANRPVLNDLQAGGLWNNSAITFPQSLRAYFNVVLGYPINLNISPERIQELEELPEVQEMGIYPARDSVKMVDGTLVVKMGPDS